MLVSCRAKHVNDTFRVGIPLERMSQESTLNGAVDPAELGPATGVSEPRCGLPLEMRGQTIPASVTVAEKVQPHSD